jgi:hypothetical protein
MPQLKPQVFDACPIPIDGKENAIEYVMLRNLKNSTINILTDLKSFHSKKKRQIENCFQKLFDNTNYDILNAPINQCIKDYLKSMCGGEGMKDQDLIVDHSINQDTIINETYNKQMDDLNNLDHDHDEDE